MKASELRKFVRKIAKSGKLSMHKMGSAALGEIRALGPLNMEQNNRICKLRNDMAAYYYEQMHDVVLAITDGVVLDAAREPKPDEPHNVAASSTKSCQICGESRAVQRCHVLPSNVGGGWHKNIIHLCPTHHFLLDHHRLSREELSKISLEGVTDRAREYFDRIVIGNHEALWSRDDLASCGELQACDVCKEYPEYFQYPPPGMDEGKDVTLWLGCKCFLRSPEYVGRDIAKLRARAAKSWNKNLRKNRWPDQQSATNGEASG